MKALIAVAALALASPAQATELVSNSGFLGPEGSTTLNGLGGALAAAPGWSLWNNTGSTTTSTLLASFGGRSNVLQITTDGGINGLYQLLAGSAHYGWADVWVESGQASFMAVANFADFASSATTSTGTWERLFLDTGPNPFDEVVLYSAGGPANFYVDGVSASEGPPTRAAEEVTAPVPEPATWAMMMLGFAAIGSAMRRRRNPQCQVYFAF